MCIVRDQLERTRAQLYAEGLSRAQDGITDSYAGCLFVNLDRSFIRLDPDNLWWLFEFWP